MTKTSKLDTIPIIKTPSLANTFGCTFLFVAFLYQYIMVYVSAAKMGIGIWLWVKLRPINTYESFPWSQTNKG